MMQRLIGIWIGRWTKMTEYEKLRGILTEIAKEESCKHEGWEQRVEILELMLPEWMSHRKQTHHHLLLNGKQWTKSYEDLTEYIQEKTEK